MAKSKWSFELLQKEALKYKTRTEFMKNSKGAYLACIRKQCLNDVCSHMEILGNCFNRLIYIYKFSDNSVYIGLTGNPSKRKKQHSEKGPVFNHIKNTGLVPIYNELTDYIHYQEASLLEIDFIEQYKNNGYNILNTQKGGGLGGNHIIWDYNKCRKEALKYNSRKEFSNNCISAYNSSQRNGWLDDICSHMTTGYKKSNFWSKELCKIEALKYSNLKDLIKNNKSCYNNIINNNWLDEICVHMNYKKRKMKNFWNYETCEKECEKYSTKIELYKNCRTAYNYAYKNNLLDLFFKKES